MRNRYIHLDFIELNWDALFAGARCGYQIYGRGAMFVDIGQILGFRLEWTTIPYLSDRATVWPMQEVAHIVKEYDPCNEIIVLFLCPFEGVSCYRISDTFIQQMEKLLPKFSHN